MRIRFAMLCAVATLACVAIGPPRAAADGADSKPEAAAVKAADAAVRTIVGDAAKDMRAAAARTAGTIAALSRAAKTGKDVATLSGVPSTPGVKVSAEQRSGLLDGCIDAVALFDDERLEHCRGAYEAFASSSACQTLAVTETVKRFPGTGGPLDRFTTGLGDAWEKGGATVDRSVQAFQVTLAKAGTAFAHVGGPAPLFTFPTVVTPPNRVTDVPIVLRTIGDSDGGLHAVVVYPGDTPAGDFRGSNTAVFAASSDGTLGFGGFRQVSGGEEGERAVFLYRSIGNASFDDSNVGQIVLLDSFSEALRPATPVSIVNPGPCVPAGGGNDITASTPLLDLGTAPAGLSASNSFVLTNNTDAPIDVTLSIVATGNNVGKFIFFNSSMRTVLNGSTAGIGVGASSTTAGTFNAKLRITWATGSLEVPLTATFTN